VGRDLARKEGPSPEKGNLHQDCECLHERKTRQEKTYTTGEKGFTCEKSAEAAPSQKRMREKREDTEGSAGALIQGEGGI